MNAKKAKSIRKEVDAAKLPRRTFETTVYDRLKLLVVSAKYLLPVNHERRVRRLMVRTKQTITETIEAYKLINVKRETRNVQRSKPAKSATPKNKPSRKVAANLA